jgi:manganese efflux pump family protein
MRFAALIVWLVTASLGAFMLRTWLARGGLSAERAKAGGLPPQLIFGHAAVAITGLLCWVVFVASGVRPFAWTALALIALAVGLGLSTVTLWTPYPARKPGERRSADEPPGGAVLGSLAPGGHAPGSPAPGGDQALGDSPSFEVTDEMIARFLADPLPAARPRPIRPNPEILVPVAHGFAAIATFALALLGAIT